MATGFLLPAPVLRAVDQNGAPLPGALLQFYLTGTTTPTPAYTSSSLGTPLANPVVADSGGLFAACFLDPSITYRVQLKTSGGSVIADIDPVSFSVQAATQAQVNAGVASGVYVDPATLAGWTGVPAALGYTPLNKAGDTATNLVINPSAPAVSSAGYLGSPINAQAGAYTLALTDAGKTIFNNGGSAITWTIPANASVAFPVGTVIAFLNTGSGSVTIAPAGGVTLNLAGAGTTGNRTLAQWGLAVAIQESANAWVITGAGLT